MANSTTGDGSYSPNIVAGVGATGTVSIDTGPLDVDFITAGQYYDGADGDGTITITGDNGVVNVADVGLYAYSRITVGEGFDSYLGTGRLYINNGASVTSTNNAALASGGIPLGGYSNLTIGTGGPNADGTVVVDGAGGFGSSILSLYGGSAGFIMGSDGGTGALTVSNGAQFFTLTGVIGAGDTTGGVNPGGTGTVTVDGVGSEFFATTNNGNFLVDSDQAPVIFVGQNDGTGNLSADNYGSITIQNVMGDGKSSPTLVFGDDLNATGGGDINNSSTLNIIQYGAANSGNRLNGNSGLIVGNAGIGQLGADGNSTINVLGDRANLVVSVGSYDGQGAPIAPLGQSQLTLYYAAVATIDSQGYSGANGAQATVGAQRLSNGRILVSQDATLNVVSSTDVAGDYTTGRIVVGDLGNGTLSAGRRGYVNASELIIGGRGYTANPLDNSTDLTFTGYNAAADGGGAGLLELTANGAQIVITATDATPDRGITLGQASGTTGTLTIENPNTGVSTGSYVKSTGGLGSIVIGEYGTGTATITGGGALYGGFITVGLGTTDSVDTLSITGTGSRTVASGAYTNVLFGGVSNGQSAVVEIGRQDGSYGRLVVNTGGALEISNVDGVNQNPLLLIATEDNSYGRAQIDGAGSAINITQNGARFLAPSGDTFGGAEAIIGRVGYANVDVTDTAQINVLGDSALLSVGDGGYDGMGAPIMSSVESNLTIATGADVLVDSQTFGFDDTAGDYSTGAAVYVGRRIGGYGRIVVSDYNSSLTVTSSSDFVGDYKTGGIIVGDLGRGALDVMGASSGFGATTDVTARSLTIGLTSFYDDGSGRQYGGYLPNVTAAGAGVVTLTGAANVVLTATENTPARGLTIGRDSGTTGSLSVSTYGSVTSQGGEGKIVVGELGTGSLTLNDGAAVRGFSLDIGRGQGSDGDVMVSGYDMLAGAFSRITLSNEFGDFSGEPENNGQAGILQIGLEDGSDGALTINGGGIVDVINQNGTTYDAPTVQLGRENGAVGTLTVDGFYSMGSLYYYSTLNITQTGAVGDFVATGGVGPQGPTLTIGQGGQGIATVSNQGRVQLQGAGANLNVATGARDAGGNPDTTTAVSELRIETGGIVTVDTQTYGGLQDFTDPGGATITAALGARVLVGGDEGADGSISLSGSGSTLRVISANETAGDYVTGQITLGANGGNGVLVATANTFVEGRGLTVATGTGSTGSATFFGGNGTFTGTDVTRYQGIQVGRDGGVGTLTVRQGSDLTSTGGAGRLQVGRDGGQGTLNINTGGEVTAFFTEIGRGAGAVGNVIIDGYGSELVSSDAYGQFDPGMSGPIGGFLRVGRDGGTGTISVENGAALLVQNDATPGPGMRNEATTLELGRGAGAVGTVTITGDDGAGSNSLLLVQTIGRANDTYMPLEYSGSLLRLGREGGQGLLTISDGANGVVFGEDARLVIGQGIENGDYNAEPTSLVTVSSGGTLDVDSRPSPDYSLPYNAGAKIIIGEETGGNGRLLVTGAGSTVSILSDNATDYYDNSGEVSPGASLQVGVLGNGVLDVENGGQISINGADNVFPNLTIGYGEDGASVGAVGAVTVDGGGSLIQIIGLRTDLGGTPTFGAGGLIGVGVNDGTTGSLTISNGGSVQNSSVGSKTEIARDIGSTGDVVVTGAGSNFGAGALLLVGASESGNTVATDQSGVGTLMINDQAVVTASSTTIGDTGTLSINDATLDSSLSVTGNFFVGGDNAVGDVTLLGELSQVTGLLEFDVFGANAGEFDTITLGDDVTLSGDAITIDVSNLANLNIGDSAVLLSTTNAISIDTTETVTFVGQVAGAGREFVLTQEFDPLGQSGPVDQLVFSVQQATLATVSGDLEIISETPGLVALTTADVSIVEVGVDPALQTLTVNSIFGGQLESAIDPGVPVTSFSQQDINDRLIRFISDGSRDSFVELGFTDSSGFADSVIVSVVAPGVPEVNVAEFPLGNALAFDGVTVGAYFGYSVSSAGDINGDGIDDLLIGARAEDGDNPGSGAAFVVFGSTVPFSNNFDLTTLDGNNGFELRGEDAEDLAGLSVSAVGDVNGDGIDDLAIGAPGADSAGGVNGAGKLYILFGDTAPVSPTVSLGSLSAGEGIAIDGGAANVGFGASVFGGDDFNGDGVADIVAGAYGVSLAGDVFVIFGDDAGLTGPADTNGLNGANGFRATGLTASEFLGSSVTMADLDNDGQSDLVIGASGALGGNGGVFVIKGAASTAATVDVTTLSGADGFRIDGLAAGDALGTSVSNIGDFNGDGVEDIVVAASGAAVGGQGDTGSVYVIFGVANGFNNATFDLATLDGLNGFQIDGRDFGDNFGQSVSGVGDMNGDGFGDFLIGAPNADPQGMITGEAYLIFGSDQGFAAQQNVTALTDTQLSLITNFDILDSGGFATGGGFDLNGDGLDDAVVGAPNAGPMDEGGALVVFGALTPEDPFIDGDLIVEAAQGQSGAITMADLVASETDATPAELLYHVTNPVGGFVAAFDTPGVPITSFTQADVNAGQVVFSKDGLTELGSFDVTVTDIDGDVGGPVTVAVQSPAGANSFNLSELDGFNGFALNGITATDQSGLAVSNAGDINGDGFDDVIVGAPQADGGGINDSGETYIVFGAAGGFAAQIELSSLDGTNGFRLTGTGAGDLSGGTVSAAGDVNNDGIDDLLVGIRNADRPSFNEGEVVVIYGSTTPFPATRALTGFDGTDGTVINGADFNSLTGATLSEAGDVNGDGIDDFIIGSPFADSTGGLDAGESFVIFGADGGLSANFNLTNLDGTNGFRIDGTTANFLVGIVGGIGDINDDGFADVAVGSQVADPASGADAGITYVVFGGPTPDPVLNVGALNGANGFRLDGLAAGDQSARSISSAGDINNDGVDDFMIGAFTTDPNGVSNAGSVYVIFGEAGGPTAGAATFDLASLDGTNGFEVQGVDANDRTGYSISNIGDFDGDGIDDILISADAGDPFDVAGAGEAYIVFGQEGGFTATIDLGALDETEGLRLNGILSGDSTGRNLSAAGDVNNDGRDDIIIGAFNADPGGQSSAGQSFVVFGFGPNQPPIARDDAFDVSADIPISGDLFAENGDDIDEDVDGDPFDLISVNGDPTQVGATITLPSGAALLVQADGLFDYDPTGAFDTLADGELAADTFIYTIGNAAGEQSTATVNLAITGVNDAPIAVDDALSFGEDDTGVPGDLFADNGFGPDSDIDNGDTFTLTEVNGFTVIGAEAVNFASGGTIVVSDDGTTVFDSNGAYEALAEGETVAETFTYTITDGLGLTSTATVNVTITGVNDAPVAQDDAFLTDEDTALSGDLFADNGMGVDEDVDSPTFTITAVNGVAANVGATITLPGFGGDLTVQTDGTFDYTPSGNADVLAEGELAAESFTYEITDDLGAVSTANVLITLNGLNDAPVAIDDTLTVSEDDDLTGSLFADNGVGPDLDIDNGDVFTITAVNGVAADVGQPIILPSGGQITVNDDGSFAFATSNAYETLGEGEVTSETLTYTITDSLGATSTANVNLDITGVNDAPVAQDDAFLTDEDTALSGDLFADNGMGVDEDVDSPTFTITAVNGVAANVGATITLPGFGGDLTVQADGTFDYTPGGNADVLAEGELAAESFTYEITDDLGAVSTANVLITLNGLNDAPVAIDDTLTVSEDDDLTGSLFANNGIGPDLDIDNGDVFTITAINGVAADVGQPIVLPSGGQITINDDGTFVFATSDAYEALGEGDVTTENLTYTITDSQGATSTATVNLDITGVNDAPVAQDDAVSITEGGAAAINVLGDNGAGPDSDIDNDALRISAANGQAVPDGGAANFVTAAGLAVTIDSSGALMLNAASPALQALAEGEQLVDSFVYVLEDEFGATDTAQVDVTVNGVNDAPVAANDLLRTDERTVINASIFADNGAGPDGDVDGAFTVTAINDDAALVGTQITLPSGALVTVASDGSVTFDPNDAFTDLDGGEQATEQLTYTITDDQGATSNATVIFTVNGIVNTVFGTPGPDLLRGTDEDDDIDGLAGNDLITGLAGNDTLKGGPGLDIIRGGADDDSLVGGGDKDRLFGEAGDDMLEGGGGGDRLRGLAGNDTLNGNTGDDTLSGGRGNDLLFGEDGNDRLRGGRDADTLIAGIGEDRLQGGGGADRLVGQAGADTLIGAGGADTLMGGRGADLLSGRRGDDELTGGLGADRFIFRLGDGDDTITDFQQGVDRIRIDNGVNSFDDLTISQVGDDALITFGNVRILAIGEDSDDFTISDFIL